MFFFKVFLKKQQDRINIRLLFLNYVVILQNASVA